MKKMKTWTAVGFDARDIGQVTASTKKIATALAKKRWGLHLAYVEIKTK